VRAGAIAQTHAPGGIVAGDGKSKTGNMPNQQLRGGQHSRSKAHHWIILMKHKSGIADSLASSPDRRHQVLTMLSVCAAVLLAFFLSDRLGTVPALLIPVLLVSLGDRVCRKLWCAADSETLPVEHELQQGLKAERDLLLALIEVSPFRIALYDPADVLVICSRSYRDSYSKVWQSLPKPVRYRDLVAASLKATGFKGDVQAEVERRAARQRDGDSSLRDGLYPDGSWLRVAKVRLDDGHIAGFGTDITELRQREEKLKAINAQLAMMVHESLPQAIKGLSALSARLTRSSADVEALASNTSERGASVATATEELSVSFEEVSRNSNDSARASEAAMEAVQLIEQHFQGLREALKSVGTFATTINTIAQQTNLLALNATIEAARAGEAGRGFAVVANEVKILAEQSARASVEIGGQLQAIDKLSRETSAATGFIASEVQSIVSRVSTIAAATSQQAATAKDVSQDVAALLTAAEKTRAASRDVLQVARETELSSADLTASIEEAKRVAA
jgi:Methyl-accepting chemotaxis protein (MCP) signalling domain/PAS fold